MDLGKGKNKEQLAKELNAEKQECLKLTIENSNLKKQVARLMAVIEFLTKGE
jgi:septal ring factor EnvC (AmiA/AmiB activator)